MNTEQSQFKLNTPTDLLNRVKAIAEAESRTVTAQINLMLRKQVKEEEKEKGPR